MCAILDNGALKCWGLAAYGRTGNGRASHDMSYIGSMASEMESLGTVNLGTGRTARQVSCGGQHTCVVLDSGQVKCFGHGNVGETGSGDSMGVGFLGIGASTDPFNVRTVNSIGNKCVCRRSNSTACHHSTQPLIVNDFTLFVCASSEQSPRSQPWDRGCRKIGPLWPDAHMRSAHRWRRQVFRARLGRQAWGGVHGQPGNVVKRHRRPTASCAARVGRPRAMCHQRLHTQLRGHLGQSSQVLGQPESRPAWHRIYHLSRPRGQHNGRFLTICGHRSDTVLPR